MNCTVALNWSNDIAYMTMESESAIESLPDEVLLMVFRFLSTDELLIAEQVCLRWKSIVDTCFATKRYLYLCGSDDALMMMRRFGPSLKSLELIACGYEGDIYVDWMTEIGERFPNLSSLCIDEMPIKSKSSTVLPLKCCQITRLLLGDCDLTDKHLEVILRGLPGLKYLELMGYLQDEHEDILGECFRELGTNIEHLNIKFVTITPAGTSHILSRATKLHALKINFGFQCDANNFSKFCEKAPLRQLNMNELELPREAFLSISNLCFLEELNFAECPEVDSEVLFGISHGCPNLKYVYLYGLPRVCDRGVKALAKCRRLTHLQLDLMHAVTDDSLFELAKPGTLESLKILGSTISDRGVSAILAQCPRLKYLDVCDCSGVGDSTVDAAIQTVESRRRLSATLDQSPNGSSTAIVPNFKSVKNSDHLLRLHMLGSQLNRYKDGLSHPLLCLYLI